LFSDSRERKKEAWRVGWKKNEAWFEAVKSYHGFEDKAAFALLGYEPRYRSYKTSLAYRQEAEAELEVPDQTAVTVAVVAGQVVEDRTAAEDRTASDQAAEDRAASGGHASVSSSAPERAEPLEIASSPPADSSEEEPMDKRRNRPKPPIKDLRTLDSAGAAQSAAGSSSKFPATADGRPMSTIGTRAPGSASGMAVQERGPARKKPKTTGAPKGSGPLVHQPSVEL